MSTEEQKDRENTEKTPEVVKDLSAPKLDAQKEEQVKGGILNERPMFDEA